MSKKKPIDKAQARERRNRMLDTAAAAQLSLTAGVREMRAIAGMTQEEFAQHRGVSARVIKAIELGQGNPTVATLNRIGQFFGLEVAFVPIERAPVTEVPQQPASAASALPMPQSLLGFETLAEIQKAMQEVQEKIDANTRMLSERFSTLNNLTDNASQGTRKVERAAASSPEKKEPRTRRKNPAQ